MRRGCVSLGETRCDSCNKIVPTADRYMITDEVTDENGKKKTVRYCVNCCVEKGLIGYRQEKDEKVLTFFPPDERPMQPVHPKNEEENEEPEEAPEEKKE